MIIDTGNLSVGSLDDTFGGVADVIYSDEGTSPKLPTFASALAGLVGAYTLRYGQCCCYSGDFVGGWR